nr:carboxypeptidase M32 [Eubacterium sp.]
YFPSYALGNAYGAQFLSKMRETVDVEKCVASGNLEPINEWNRENIWKHGGLYTPQQLLSRVLGTGLNADYYVDYLTEKYTEIYDL